MGCSGGQNMALALLAVEGHEALPEFGVRLPGRGSMWSQFQRAIVHMRSTMTSRSNESLSPGSRSTARLASTSTKETCAPSESNSSAQRDAVGARREGDRCSG